MKAVHKSFFLNASSSRTLLEASILAGIILSIQVFSISDNSRDIVQQSFFILTFLIPLYAGLRMRKPEGRFKYQARAEFKYTIVGSLVLLLLIILANYGIKSRGVSLQNDLTWSIIFPLPAVSGLAYLVLRAFIRLWVFWNRLRSEKMVWSLTNAILVLIMGVVALVLVLLITFGIANRTSSHLPSNSGFFLIIYDWLIYTLLPMVGIFAFLAGIALVFILPPAALFSYLYARKTASRIDKLAKAAHELESGQLDTRVTVQGKDEVAQLQSSFNAMALQMQQTLTELQIERDKFARLLKTHQELVAGVSHDLRTPVTVIRGYTETLQQNGTVQSDAALNQQLSIMKSEVLRLQNLLEDLFTLSRAEVGQLTIHCQTLSLDDPINRVVQTFAPLARNSGRIEISAQIPHNLPPICVDESRLSQILANLVRNAIRFTPPGGLVLVSAADDDGAVRVDVRDTGVGISPEDLPHIWNRYYQAPGGETCDLHGNAGLGLALVKELTEAMGGTVSVVSTIGEGSCFSLVFPSHG